MNERAPGVTAPGAIPFADHATALPDNLIPSSNDDAPFVDRYPVKFGDPGSGAAAGGAPGFGRFFFVVDPAFVGTGGAGVAVVVAGLVSVEAVVVVDGGGLPAVVSARATVENCGATQTAALAARPALTVAFANSRRVNPPARSPSLSPRPGTLSTLANRAVYVKGRKPRVTCSSCRIWTATLPRGRPRRANRTPRTLVPGRSDFASRHRLTSSAEEPAMWGCLSMLAAVGEGGLKRGPTDRPGPPPGSEHLRRRVSWQAFAACRLAVVEDRDMPKVPGALEVMPPPPVGPDEDRAALKPLIARSRARDVGPMVDFAVYRAGPDDSVQVDFDEEPTLTAPVVPGLVSKDGERPADLSSVIAGDFQVSGCDVGLILVVVDSEPRRRELHGWHGAPPRAARLSAQKYPEVMGGHKRTLSQISNTSHRGRTLPKWPPHLLRAPIPAVSAAVTIL
jgi:hypothetical protein